MPQEITKHATVLDAIKNVGAIADITAAHEGHYDYEIDLEVIVYGRNYNGKKVGPYVRLLTYGPGEEIIREGEWGGNTFYFVSEGKAEVFVKGPSGESRVAELPAGVQFGEMSVLAGVPRAATVRAPRDASVQILEVQRPALRLLRKLPKFGDAARLGGGGETEPGDYQAARSRLAIPRLFQESRALQRGRARQAHLCAQSGLGAASAAHTGHADRQ
jgi:hypothetical protein